MSLPGYFGVQPEGFADFPARPAAAQLPPPSETAAAVAWLNTMTPGEDAPTMGLDALGGRCGPALGTQQIHTSASAETAELGRDRASFPPDRDFAMTMCVPDAGGLGRAHPVRDTDAMLARLCLQAVRGAG